MKNEPRRVIAREGGSEVRAYVSDEEAAGGFMQSYRASEKTGQQRTERSEGNEATLVVEDELAAEVGVAIVNAHAGFAGLEFSFDVVVAQAPLRAIGFGGDTAEWFEEFEESDVVPAIVLDERQRIVCRNRIDGEMFLRRRRRQQERGDDCNEEESAEPPNARGTREQRRSWDLSRHVSPAHKR